MNKIEQVAQKYGFELVKNCGQPGADGTLHTLEYKSADGKIGFRAAIMCAKGRNLQ